MKLGKLQEVDIRKVWPHEQYDFSKWLAEEENIKELGDTLNLTLTDVETEKFVGNYRCDILCKDEITGKMVLIENQLEPTNHDHLGKIITYASGLDAAVVVWIVSSARDEHASAIEWLNKHTDDEISFFLLEVHAYKIGDSNPAPQFNIIEQPNDFVKTVKTVAKNSELNESQKQRLEFWTQFNDVVEAKGKTREICVKTGFSRYFIRTFVTSFEVYYNEVKGGNHMKQRIYNERNDLWYTLCGDYYVPELSVPEENRPIGKWGRMHREYLKEHHPIRFNDLVLSGQLWTYLADLNEQAQERLSLIIKQMKVSEGVTEELKAADQMAWVGAMNSIRNRAEEIILRELIYGEDAV